MNHTLRYISFVLSVLMAAVASQSAVLAQTKDAEDIKKEYRKSFFKYGIKGGIDFISVDKFVVGEISEAVSTYTGFTAGVAFSFDLPVQGMTLQPELKYASKGARVRYGGDDVNLRIDYIELPVNLQVGLDLILMRPFITLSPYIGYAVYHTPAEIGWEHFGRFEYGIGVGGGLDIWRFQLQLTYNWNLSGMMQTIEAPSGTPVMDPWQGMVKSVEGSNLRGLEISLVFFF